MWATWDSMEDFNSWHNAIKAELGIPKPSVNAANEVVEDAVINEEYTTPFVVAVDDVRAYVQQEYAAGLQVSTNPNESHY